MFKVGDKVNIKTSEFCKDERLEGLSGTIVKKHPDNIYWMIKIKGRYTNFPLKEEEIVLEPITYLKRLKENKGNK